MKSLKKFGVFTRAELESRAEIKYEAYAKAVNIEARAMIDICKQTYHSGSDHLYYIACEVYQ